MTHSNFPTKLTQSERTVLAIMGGRLPSGVMGKDRIQLLACDLAHDGIYLKYRSGEYTLTELGRDRMARATAKNNHFSKMAESKKIGAGKRMADILNLHGTRYGYEFLRDLGATSSF